MPEGSLATISHDDMAALTFWLWHSDEKLYQLNAHSGGMLFINRKHLTSIVREDGEIQILSIQYNTGFVQTVAGRSDDTQFLQQEKTRLESKGKTFDKNKAKKKFSRKQHEIIIRQLSNKKPS